MRTAGCGVVLEEAEIPLRPDVRGFCEILGLDPLYLANEGVLAVFAPPDQAEAACAAMRGLAAGRNACITGRAVDEHAGTVTLRTTFGGERIVDMLAGEQLPRIC